MPHEDPKPESAVAQWRKTAAELVRPVPFQPPVSDAGVAGPPAEKVNYLRLLWNRKFWIVGGLLLGAILGLLAVIFQVPVYHGSTTVEVLPVNEAFMQMGQYDPQAGSYAMNNTYALTQLRIITSPSQVARVYERIMLELPPVSPTSNYLFSSIRKRLGLVPQEPVEFMRFAVRQAASTVTARILGATRLVEITSDSSSPEVAAAFANAVAGEYIARNSEFRASSATKTIQWMQTQIEEAKNRYEQADTKLQDFIKKQGLAFVMDQSTLADSKLRALQADLAGIQTERINKQSRYELAKSSPVDSLPEILDDGTLVKLRLQMDELRKERALLTSTYTPEHYKVARVDAQIADLGKAMQREKENLVKRIQNEYEAALRRERLIGGAYSAQAQSLANQGEKATEYSLLKREVELSKQSYNALVQSYDQATVSTSVPASNVRVLEPAVPVQYVFKPKPSTDISLGAAMGAFLVMGFTVIRELVRVKGQSRVFASPGHVSPVLNVPELGVIPAFSKQPAHSSHWPGARLFKRGAGNGNGHGVERDVEMVEWNKPSFLAESFRYTLTSVLARHSDSDRLMLILTSPGSGEGKSTVISNLAAATAETGRRVLLIDADLRRPHLHKFFHLERKQGLSELLQSDIPVADIDLRDYIQPTSIPRLSVVTGGSREIEAVGSLLFSEGVADLFSRFREAFDVVLIDTAPALLFSDARLLGQLCDGVILIVRAGVTFRENALAAAKRLTDDRIPILGTILNDWHPETTGQTPMYPAHYPAY